MEKNSFCLKISLSLREDFVYSILLRNSLSILDFVLSCIRWNDNDQLLLELIFFLLQIDRNQVIKNSKYSINCAKTSSWIVIDIKILHVKRLNVLYCPICVRQY